MSTDQGVTDLLLSFEFVHPVNVTLKVAVAPGVSSQVTDIVFCKFGVFKLPFVADQFGLQPAGGLILYCVVTFGQIVPGRDELEVETKVIV